MWIEINGAMYNLSDDTEIMLGSKCIYISKLYGVNGEGEMAIKFEDKKEAIKTFNLIKKQLGPKNYVYDLFLYIACCGIGWGITFSILEFLK